MALIRPVRSHEPQIHDSCFLAENSTIIGDVRIDAQSSVWYQVVIRGDVNSIVIGKRCNIQDGTIIHCSYQKADVRIGDDVSIGHRAIIHGCHIQSGSLIGMGATVMDHVIVESNVVVAAGALVPEGMRLESGYIFAGLPAKKMRALTAEEKAYLIDDTPQRYIKYASWFTE